MAGSSLNAAMFIRAESEEALQKAFLAFQIKTSKQYEIINVYPTKGGVVIWFRAYVEIGSLK